MSERRIKKGCLGGANMWGTVIISMHADMLELLLLSQRQRDVLHQEYSLLHMPSTPVATRRRDRRGLTRSN